MQRILKKVNLSWGRKSRTIESDAAPSPPRPQNRVPSSSSSEEDEQEETWTHDPKMNGAPKTDDFPDFKEKMKQGASSNGSQSFAQTTNIEINGSSNIQIGHQYHFGLVAGMPGMKMPNMSTPDSEPPRPSKPQPPPPEIENMFSNREPVQTKDILVIQVDVGSNWQAVVENLGLEKSTIQGIFEKHKHKGSNEVFYHLMLKWMESSPRTTATVGILCEALWNANQTSAASKLCSLHRTHDS